MEIVVSPEADVPLDLRLQVVALQDHAWPADQPTRPTHDPALRPLSMLLVDGGCVVAALDILSKEIVHRSERYAASGLSTVVTDRAHRGKGYGRQLVEAARRVIAASGADLGIFTCDRPLQAFYERAGWQVLVHTVLIGGTPSAPFPSDQFDKVVMACFFSARACDAAASFAGARIELYPGEIDKLW
jgi:aminoglycoside 2'-N-acetyltransferase I